MMPLDPARVRQAVAAALAEDLSGIGDVTTAALVDEDRRAEGHLVARQELVLAGCDVAREVFRALDEQLVFAPHRADGERLSRGERVASVSGRAAPILQGERTALNFLMRMCGIATATHQAVQEIAGSGAQILMADWNHERARDALHRAPSRHSHTGGGEIE